MLRPRMSPETQSHREWKKPVLLSLAIAGIFGMGAYARREFGITLDLANLRPLVQEAGAWGPLIYIGITSTRMFLGVPSQLVLVVGGACFGTVFGMVYGGLGLIISGLATFVGARWAGREVVEARIPTRLKPLFDMAGGNLGAGFIFIGTAYPIGFITAYNAIAGVTKLSLSRFLPAVSGGSMVRAGTYAYFGSSLLEGSIEAVLLAGTILGAVAILPLIFPRSRRWIASLLPR
jgi:uncharacterized membrane protein YdjX (TVP38/TMEM64 family)